MTEIMYVLQFSNVDDDYASSPEFSIKLSDIVYAKLAEDYPNRTVFSLCYEAYPLSDDDGTYTLAVEVEVRLNEETNV